MINTETPVIGYYTRLDSTEGHDLDFADFVEGVRSGPEWKKHVEWVRSAPDQFAPPTYTVDDKGKKKKVPTEYDKRKFKSACVTIAGTFNGEKKTENLRQPSGLMAIDLDDLNDEVEAKRNLLTQDPFIYACFLSIGGAGLCVVIRVNPDRWDDSFNGAREYFIEKYGLVGKQFDPSSSNINRLRYISHDPAIYTNYKAQLFRKYPRKEKPQNRHGTVHTETDIRFVLDQIHARAVDITGGYNEWYKIGWALISKYGEGARGMFHEVSGYSMSYDADECDKKFNYLLRTLPKRITIATFYYHCKQAGLEIISPRTTEIVRVAQSSKKQKISQRSAVDTVLSQIDGVTPEDAATVVEQVYASEESFDTGDSLFDQIELFLRLNYPMRRNLITRHIETLDGKPYHQEEFNDIYRALRKHVDDKIKYVDMERIILSSFTPTYNPFTEFFVNNRHRTGDGYVQQLVDTVETDTGFDGGNFSPDFARYFIRKWLLGIIDSMHGGHSPLCLVFAGGINIGKTEWFRRLLPEELQPYFGESKLDKGKDDEILMCKKLILFNDEFGGMTKGDVKHFKNLTSKQVFNLREPFGRSHVDLRRIAVLCGSSNEHDLLNDPTGNRRIIPLHTTRFDWKAYNAIDKADLLMEVYHAYQAGERHHLTMDDIALLNDNTKAFEDICVERELIQKYYTVPDDKRAQGTLFLSNTEIKVFLEKVSQQRMGIKRLSQEMTKLGFVCEMRKVRNQMKRGYAVHTETEHADIDRTL